LSNARGTNCAWAKARILPTFIRRNIKLAEAPSYGKTIFEYEQNCHGAEDYIAVAEYIHSGSKSHGQGQTHKPAPAATPIQDIPKAPEPAAATQQQTPTKAPQPVANIQDVPKAPERVAIRPVQAPAKSPEPPQPIRQASNPAPAPVRPVAQDNSQPKPRLSSTYEYRPQPPVAPSKPQTQLQPNNINGTPPVVAENRSAAPQSIQAQNHRPQQPNIENRPLPQVPVNNTPTAANPQPTVNPKPQSQLNNTYQYRPTAPVPNKPVPTRTIQRQPQPNPQQKAAKLNNGQPPAARIIEITPLNQPKPIPQPEPDRATPAEPTQEN